MVKVLLAAAVLVCVAPQDSKFGHSYLGKAPPEIVATKDQWINAPEGLKLGALQGPVVWLEFGFLKCAPCRKMMPIMQKWHTEFGPKGLVVVDIHVGDVDLAPLQLPGGAPGVVADQHVLGGLLNDQRLELAVGFQGGRDRVHVSTTGVARVGT